MSLDDALAELAGETRRMMEEHVHGGSSSEWLADWFRRAGIKIDAATIERDRKLL